MSEHLVITIGREYGSGGREIGKKLAEALGIKFYDKELIRMAAKESGMSQEAFEKVDEIASGSLLYSVVTSTYGASNLLDLPLNDKLFILQANIIKTVAQKEDCIIVGRCADYILKDKVACINLFIHAPLEKRVAHAVANYGLEADKAKQKISKIDKKRATYYNYYTNNKWGKAKNYDLAIDSSVLGIDGTVDFIKQFIEAKRQK